MGGFRFVQVAAAILLVLASPAAAGAARSAPLAGTVDALLALTVRPVAIGHRGAGENHPSRPRENTVESVRAAFEAGITVIEIDVQLTRDQHVVAYHDDVLPDGACLNTLTRRELQSRLSFIPTLQAVLEEARSFNRATGPLQGLVIIELKAARPLCDPRDRQDLRMVLAAAHAVRHVGMTQQVLFTSFSPAILELARIHAADIPRILAVSILQFLSQEDAETTFGTTVTLIEKKHDLGLRWAEIGTILRLPGYRSFEELIATALTLQARVVEVDLSLLQAAGPLLVPALHAAGLKVFGFTVDDADEWAFLEGVGVDGIYTNDIPLGIGRQPPIP